MHQKALLKHIQRLKKQVMCKSLALDLLKTDPLSWLNFFLVSHLLDPEIVSDKCSQNKDFPAPQEACRDVGYLSYLLTVEPSATNY